MNVNCLIVERKKAKAKRQQAESKDLITRAIKATNTPHAPQTPAAEIAMLKRYIQSLETAMVDLAREFGDDSNSALGRLRTEKIRVIEHIGTILRQQAKPKVL